MYYWYIKNMLTAFSVIRVTINGTLSIKNLLFLTAQWHICFLVLYLTMKAHTWAYHTESSAARDRGFLWHAIDLVNFISWPCVLLLVETPVEPYQFMERIFIKLTNIYIQSLRIISWFVLRLGSNVKTAQIDKAWYSWKFLTKKQLKACSIQEGCNA